MSPSIYDIIDLWYVYLMDLRLEICSLFHCNISDTSIWMYFKYIYKSYIIQSWSNKVLDWTVWCICKMCRLKIESIHLGNPHNKLHIFVISVFSEWENLVSRQENIINFSKGLFVPISSFHSLFRRLQERLGYIIAFDFPCC